MINIEKDGRKLWIDWPLDENSIIYDIGGFGGEWTEIASSRFKGTFYIFEPIKEFYDNIVSKFSGKLNIIPYNFAVSDADKTITLGVRGDATSECGYMQFPKYEKCSAVNINTFLPERVNVMAINCEGAEFEIVNALCASGNINKVDYLQIQFHNFVPNYKERHEFSCSELSKTHTRIYLWEDVWEVWMRTALIEESKEK